MIIIGDGDDHHLIGRGGLGLAYRFQPDGTLFDKPATLTFRYESTTVENNDPNVFQVAYQGSDKRWYQQPGATTDTASQHISVLMPHFSDWSAYEIAKIEYLSIDGGPAKGEYLISDQTNILTCGDCPVSHQLVMASGTIALTFETASDQSQK